MRVGIPSPFQAPKQPSPTTISPTTSQPTPPHAIKAIVPAGHGHAFPIPANSTLRITDLHGTQIVDLFAWPAQQPSPPGLEHLSAAYTRYHLRGVAPTINEHLYSNADRKLLKVLADTVKVHDMTFPACYPQMYAEGHRSCKQNVFEAMRKFGMSDVLEVPEPFNCFQNTPNYSLKAIGSSRPGDYVEFEVLQDLVVCVSACPFDGEGWGAPTDVEIKVWT